MNRNRAIAATLGCLVGLAAGVLLFDQRLPDVLTVAAALFVLAVWTVAAGYVGAFIERRANDARFDDMLDAALELRRQGERQRSLPPSTERELRRELREAFFVEARRRGMLP